jgi:hypothetical protein
MATDTHSAYVIIIAFPWQQWLGETLLNVTTIRSLPVLFSNSYDPYRRIDPGQIIICAYCKVIYA